MSLLSDRVDHVRVTNLADMKDIQTWIFYIWCKLQFCMLKRMPDNEWANARRRNIYFWIRYRVANKQILSQNPLQNLNLKREYKKVRLKSSVDGGWVCHFIFKCKERLERQSFIILKTQYFTLMVEPLIYYVKYFESGPSEHETFCPKKNAKTTPWLPWNCLKNNNL